MSEQRRRTRVKTQFGAAIRVGGKEFPVVTQNLSLKGLLCQIEYNLEEGTQCEIIFALSDKEKIVIKSKVVRCDNQNAALEFLRMDTDSFTHLRQIVRAYAENPDQIDEELSKPAFDSDEE